MAKSQFYVNRDVRYLIDRRIYEYDIRRAGLQALVNIGAIDAKTYEMWKARDKHWSSIFIGTHMAKYMRAQNDDITKGVDEFLRANAIQNSRIISRKRDAVFIFPEMIPKVTKVNGYQFVCKHRYTSYYHIENLELYYNSFNDTLDVKGIDARFTENHPLIDELKKIIRLYELCMQGTVSYEEVYTEVHELRNQYCELKLPLEWYREIAYDNPYAFKDKRTGAILHLQVLPSPEERLNYELMTSYNFMKIIVPFIRILPELRYINHGG